MLFIQEIPHPELSICWRRSYHHHFPGTRVRTIFTSSPISLINLIGDPLVKSTSSWVFFPFLARVLLLAFFQPLQPRCSHLLSCQLHFLYATLALRHRVDGLHFQIPEDSFPVWEQMGVWIIPSIAWQEFDLDYFWIHLLSNTASLEVMVCLSGGFCKWTVYGERECKSALLICLPEVSVFLSDLNSNQLIHTQKRTALWHEMVNFCPHYFLIQDWHFKLKALFILCLSGYLLTCNW